MSEEVEKLIPVEAAFPAKKDAAWHIQAGLVWIGLLGAGVSFIILKLVQSQVAVDHPLNQKYRDGPVWVPGAFLVVGPVLGLAYYALFAKKVDDPND